jgi:hypothetical protein
MAVDGNWKITIETPMGNRPSELSLSTAGGKLTGRQGAEGNSGEITDGTVNGNEVSWKIKITNPMPMTLHFSGKVDGDKISGSADAGTFGSFPFSGARA